MRPTLKVADRVMERRPHLVQATMRRARALRLSLGQGPLPLPSLNAASVE